MDGELRFRLLGGLRALRASGDVEVEVELGGPRPRRLLAALLLSPGQPLPPDRLVELVWGEEAPASARSSVHSYISNLRRALAPIRPGGGGGTTIELRPGGYVLAVARAQLDVGAVEAVVSSCRTSIERGRPRGAVADLQAVLDGWAPLLPELAEVPFVRAEAAHLDARRAEAFELLQAARLAIGQHHEAIADLCRAVSLDPRAERLWALLALAQQGSGRGADAIATIHAARTALAEAGLAPGIELRDLEADLFAGGGVTDGRHGSPVPPVATVGVRSAMAVTRPPDRPCHRAARDRRTTRACPMRR